MTYEATGSQTFDVEYDKPGTQGFEDSVKRSSPQNGTGNKWTLTVTVKNLDNLSLTVGGAGRTRTSRRWRARSPSTGS
ncbi:hypothetical protein NKH77_27305 [Streptomyces sp. M19]